MSEVKKIEFFSGRVSYITLRCRWCDTIALNVYALKNAYNILVEKLESKRPPGGPRRRW
jgi:hypothetical protein